MIKSSLKTSAAVFLMFGFLLFVQSAQASILYLSPGNGSITPGATKSVQIRFSGQGDVVNGVTAVLSYPADKLEVASISYGGSAFAIAAEGSSGGGNIRISRANIGGVGGDVNLATVNFRGKAAGAATVAFNGGSAAPRASDSSDSLNLGSSRGGTFTVGGTTAAAPSTATPTPIKSLLIENIKVENVSSNSATISWTTSSKTPSYLTYGLEKDQYIVNLAKDVSSTSHSAKIEGPLLTPGGTFHFRIKAEDTLGNEWSSEDSSFHLPGYELRILITDDQNQPVIGAAAELFGYNLKKTTDSSGQVIFNDLLPGRQLLIVKSNDQERSQEIVVADSPMSQNYNFKIAAFRQAVASTETTPNMTVVIGLAVVLVIIVIILVIYLLRRRPTPPSTSTPQTP